MDGYNGNDIPVSDSPGIGEKFGLEPKANAENGSAEQVLSDETAFSKEVQLSRKQKMAPCEEKAEGVLSGAHIYYPGDSSEERRSNSSASSSERKRRSDDLLDDLIQKKQKHHMNSSDKYANLNMKKLIACGIDLQKQERSGSSSKRSRDSYDSDAGLEGEVVSGDDSIAKRRKVGHSFYNIELKMLGPLKLPDYVKGFKYELGPETIKLNKQLIDINKKLRAGGTINKNRVRAKLDHRRQQIICELNQKNPLFRPPSNGKPTKFSRKLYIPVKLYPNYNFIGLIIGPRGHTQKRMEKESGARILLRGKGSTRPRKGKQYKDPRTEPFEDEDLHVYIEAEDEKCMETASEMVEKLLVPVNEDVNEHKHAQLRELAELNSEIEKDERSVPEIENSSHQPALVSLPHCIIKSENDIKLGEVIDKAKLFVGFLPLSVNSEKLVELFSPFGSLSEAVVIMDRNTGLSKGYGFVKYSDALSAMKALVQMNGFRIDGKIIAVRVAGRVPLNVNTVIGPRALRFANSLSNPVSAGMHPHAFSKCWNFWALLPEAQACIPLCAEDSMYRRRPQAFAGFSEQSSVGSSLVFGGTASSIEYVPLPCLKPNTFFS